MDGTSSILGTDVGGTFTDLALITANGELHCFKTPSKAPYLQLADLGAA
jgi:N-methylhydantoinase A/oxoprolinase/acetone carboxylase beta subunit